MVGESLSVSASLPGGPAVDARVLQVTGKAANRALGAVVLLVKSSCVQPPLRADIWRQTTHTHSPVQPPEQRLWIVRGSQEKPRR